MLFYVLYAHLEQAFKMCKATVFSSFPLTGNGLLLNFHSILTVSPLSTVMLWLALEMVTPGGSSSWNTGENALTLPDASDTCLRRTKARWRQVKQVLARGSARVLSSRYRLVKMEF